MLKLNEDPGTGLRPDIPIERYHIGPGVSKSQLDLVAKSPAHYLAGLDAPKKETPALRIGRLFHALILEPDTVKIAVAPACDKRTKNGKSIWERFCADNEGAEIVSGEESDILYGMKANVQRHPAANALLHSAGGWAEHSAYWTDPQSGILCRCRPDFYRPDGIIVDLKTTEDASPDAFARSVAKYRYHVQAAFYSDGVATVTGDFINGFAFIAVEKSAPFAVAVYQLDEQATSIGRDLYQRDLATLAECQNRNEWPAYSRKIETLSLPRWAAMEAIDV